MLRIRPDQMQAFSEDALRDFEDRMLVHLSQFFPDQCEALGEPGVRDAVRYGIRRAAEHQIVIERDVRRYLDLMFAFGRDFDKDLNLPWADAILSQDMAASERMEQLYQRSLEYVRKVAEE